MTNPPIKQGDAVEGELALIREMIAIEARHEGLGYPKVESNLTALRGIERRLSAALRPAAGEAEPVAWQANLRTVWFEAPKDVVAILESHGIEVRALYTHPAPAASGGEADHFARFGPFTVGASNEGGAWSIVVSRGRTICAIVDEAHPAASGAAPVVPDDAVLIRQAVARGWCAPENAHKEMDVVLAHAIAREVLALAAAPSSGPVGGEDAKPQEGEDLPDVAMPDGTLIPAWIVLQMQAIAAWFKVNGTTDQWHVGGIGPLPPATPPDADRVRGGDGCCDVCHGPLEEGCLCQNEYNREHDRHAER